MAEEHRISISSSPSLGADEVARRTFTTVRKGGFDPQAVRAFLETVAEELRAGARREDELRSQLAEAERRAATPELDEGTLAAALGAETGRVLQTAHEAARQLVERAEARAAEVAATAERLAAERSAEGEDEARRIREEARATSAVLVDTARSDAERLIEATKSECRSMLAEARQVREKVLRDLSERRRVLRLQVEQLLAGRGTLMSAVDGVREAVEDLTERLARAEYEARDAAQGAMPVADAEGEEGEEGAAYVAVAASLVTTGEDARLSGDQQVDEIAPAEAGEGGSDHFEGVKVLEGASAAPLVPAAEEDEEAEEGVPSEDTKVAVDELFAKIRASRAEQVARARQILEGGGEEEAPGAAASEVGAEAPGDAAGVEQPAEEQPIAAVPDEAVPSPAAAEATATETESDAATVTESIAVTEEAEPAAGPAAALARREQLLAPALARLSRALKRALQDDQNDLLDRLRHAPPTASLDDLLPHEEQERRYEAAAKSGIEAARRAGLSFAAEDLGASAANDVADAGEQVRGGARRLAEELVGALRLRIAGGLAAAEADREGAGADVVGVAFRELKGSRVSEVAGDHATRAFSSAQVAALSAAVPDGSKVVWVVDDGGTHCPDCDDNALAGPQSPGEPFPTGQKHPPVHPGCRCLLVVVPS